MMGVTVVCQDYTLLFLKIILEEPECKKKKKERLLRFTFDPQTHLIWPPKQYRITAEAAQPVFYSTAKKIVVLLWSHCEKYQNAAKKKYINFLFVLLVDFLKIIFIFYYYYYYYCKRCLLQSLFKVLLVPQSCSKCVNVNVMLLLKVKGDPRLSSSLNFWPTMGLSLTPLNVHR